MKLKTRALVRSRKYRDWQKQIRSDRFFFGLMDRAKKNVKPSERTSPKGRPIYNWGELSAEMKRLHDIDIGKRV